MDVINASAKLPAANKSNSPGLGAEYEVLLPAYLGLQFLKNGEIKDFRLRSNVRSFDKFDDLLVDIIMKNDGTHHFAIQLKHKERNVKLSPASFHTASNFNLEKYCEAYNTVIKNEDYNYIIYTNASFNSNKIKEVTNYKMLLSEDSLAKNLFDTSPDDGNVYKFDVNEETNKKDDFLKFFPRFSLFVSQKNSKRLEEAIKNIFKIEYAAEDEKYSTEYINIFRKWHKKEYANDVLDRKTLSIHFVDLLLGNYTMKPSPGPINRNEKLDLLEESVRTFNVTIIEDLELKLVNEMGKWEQENSLPSYIEDLVKKFANDFQIKDSEVVDQCILRLAREYKFVDKFQKIIETKVRRKIFHYFFEKPIFIIYNEESNRKISNALQTHLMKNINVKFVILGKSVNTGQFGKLENFKTLQDLCNKNKKLYQEIIEKFEISLQGRNKVPLSKLIAENKEMPELIQVKHLFQDDVNIGQQLETLPEYYLPRTVSSIIFEEKDIVGYFLKQNHLLVIDYGDELDYIKNVAESISLQIIDVDEFVELSGKIKTNENVKYVVITKEVYNKQQFENICSLPYKNIDYFKLNKEHKFILVKSKNNNEKVYSKGMFLEESQVLSFFSQNINVLCAEPGMGKTSTMKSLRNRCPSNHWTVFLELKQFKSLFFKVKLKADQILKHLLKNENEDPVVTKMRSIFLNQRNMSLFLDGLDELDSESISNVLIFVDKLKYKGFNVWLSSRNNLKEKIENKLNLFTIDINELNEEQQSRYIYNRLQQNNYSNEEISKIIENIFKSVSVRNNTNILGIPLQLFMVTQIFIDEKRNDLGLNENLFVLTKLYANYFDGKIKHTLYKKGLKDELEIRRISKLVQNQYQISSLKTCLDNEDLEKLKLGHNDLKEDEAFLDDIQENNDSYGIIKKVSEDKTAIFVHHTHGEYFAAMYFSKNFDKVQILKDRLFTKKYDNLRLLLDIKLAENCPLHLSVIYKNLEQFNEYFENFNPILRDAGGRTLLHLACTYATKYSPLTYKYKNKGYYYDIPKVIKAENNFYKRIVDEMINLNVVNQGDDLFNWNETDYALKCWCFYPLEAILKKYHQDNSSSSKALSKFWPLHLGKTSSNKRPNDMILNLNETFSDTDKGSMVYYAASLGYLNLLRAVFASNFSIKRFKYEWQNSTKYDKRPYDKRHHNTTCLLIKNKGDVNCVNAKGATPLHLACLNGHTEFVLSLIQSNANVNAVNRKNTYTPLHYACLWGRNEVAISLIQNKANVNAVNKYGFTPLYYACDRGLTEVAAMLIQNGADVNAVNKELLRSVGLQT